MILDDNSMEKLKDPQSVAEVRIATLTRAQKRLEAVVTHKFNLLQPEPVLISEQTTAVIVSNSPVASVSQETITQPETSSELNIDAIRFSVERAIREHIETVEDVSA